MPTPNPAPSNFLTIAEVATLLRVSTMTVYRLVQTHDIEAARFGRQFRISQEAVDAYIQRATLQDD